MLACPSWVSLLVGVVFVAAVDSAQPVVDFEVAGVLAVEVVALEPWEAAVLAEPVVRSVAAARVATAGEEASEVQREPAGQREVLAKALAQAQRQAR